VICEILNPDGSMARTTQLMQFSKKHKLKIVTIKDLIEHRRLHERLVKRMGSARLPTEYGEFQLHVYEEALTGKQHLALVKGVVEGQKGVLARVHSSCITGDSLFSARCDCGKQLAAALKRIDQEGRGVLVYLAQEGRGIALRAIAAEERGLVLYLRQEGRGIGLLNKIRSYALQDKGLDTVEANLALGFKADLREYGIGAQILADLGLSTLRILTNNPRKIVGIEGYGLRVTERVPLQVPHTKHNVHYMRTKKAKMGHWITEEMR
jgi:3,4-dihydroxy 2-butanone 4-phosphate synthase/GTP cyclohydrolase II